MADTKPQVQEQQAPKPFSALSDAEKRERYKQYRQKTIKSRLEVKGEPNIHYAWIEKDDHAEILRLEGVGYWVVKEVDPKKPKITASGLQADGTYAVGSVLLMACPQETY